VGSESPRSVIDPSIFTGVGSYNSKVLNFYARVLKVKCSEIEATVATICAPAIPWADR
jgi:hypothetical protein